MEACQVGVKDRRIVLNELVEMLFLEDICVLVEIETHKQKSAVSFYGSCQVGLELHHSAFLLSALLEFSSGYYRRVVSFKKIRVE